MSLTWEDKPTPETWADWEARILAQHEATKQPLQKRWPWWVRWPLGFVVGSGIGYFLLWGGLEGWKYVGR